MDNKVLITQHEPGLAGLWRLYPPDMLRRGALWPTILSIALILCFLLSGLDSQILVKNIIDAVISVMPSLLGFLLGGYTILISFANSALFKGLTNKPNDSKISAFQKLSCIFALTILLQALCLIMALVARFSMLVEFNFGNWVIHVNSIISVINYFFGAVLMAVLFYTVIAFKDIISNIFSLTQFFHLLMMNKVEEKPDNSTD